MTNITTGGTVEIIWYDLDETTVLYRTDYFIPSPQSEGHSYWRWYSVASWIGHFPHEIKGPGRYKVQINTFLGSRTLYYTVYSNKGSISCKSTPHGASILLGKVIPNQQTIYVNQNKITLAFIPVILTNIDPGRYSVMFIKDGYDRCLSEVTVAKESEVLASCTLPRTVTTGKLECISSPAGALVYLDGRSNSAGTCPFIISDLQPGTHTILFKLSGYEDCQKQIEVYVGQTRVISCTLKLIPTTIECSTVPTSAQIFLDGTNTLQFTPRSLEVSSGEHKVMYYKSGFEPTSRIVNAVSKQAISAYALMFPKATNPIDMRVYIQSGVSNVNEDSFFEFINKISDLYNNSNIPIRFIASELRWVPTVIDIPYSSSNVDLAFTVGENIGGFNFDRVGANLSYPYGFTDIGVLSTASEFGHYFGLIDRYWLKVTNVTTPEIPSETKSSIMYDSYTLSNRFSPLEQKIINLTLSEGIKYPNERWSEVLRIYIGKKNTPCKIFASNRDYNLFKSTFSSTPTITKNTDSDGFLILDTYAVSNVTEFDIYHIECDNWNIWINSTILDENFIENGVTRYCVARYLNDTQWCELFVEDIEEIGYINCQAKDSITNAPLNATLQIDGVTIVPKTPHTTPAIPIGPHNITFILDGYSTITVPVTVFSGQTAHVFGVMVPAEVPGPGFDITVNVPSIPVLQPLHVVRVIQFPFTNTWVPLVIAPIIGTQIKWNNISNQLYKARQNEFDCRPAPELYSGTPIKEGEHYAIHAGKQISPIYTDDIVHTVTSDKVSVTVSKLADIPPWLITLCGYFDVSPGNCITSFYNVIPDIAYSAEDISIIKDGKSIYPPYDSKTPTTWNYLFAGMPFCPIGKIARVSKPLSRLVKDTKLTLGGTLDTNKFLTELKDLNLLHHLTEMQASKVDEITDLITQEEWVLIKAELAKNGRYITAYEFMRYATEVDPNLFKKGYVNALIHSTWGEYTDISKITEKIELLDSSGATKRRQWWHEFIESLESVVGKTRSEEIVQNLGLDKIIARAKRNEKIFLLGLDEYRDIVKKLEDLGVPKSTVDDMLNITDTASAKPFFKRFLAETLAYPTKHPGKSALWIIGSIAGLIGTSEFILWKFKEMLLDPPNFNLVKAVQLGDHETALEHLAHFKYMIEGSEPSFKLVSYASPFSITMIPLYLDNMKKTHDMYADILGVPEQKFFPNEYLFPETIVGEVIEIKDGDTVRCNFKLLGVPEKGATSPENSTVYKHNGEVLEKGGTFIPGDLEHDVRFLGINTPEDHLYDYSCTNVREPYLVRRLEAIGNECISEETWHVDSDFYNSTKVWIGNKLPLHKMATFKSDINNQFGKHGRLLAVPWINGTNICLKSLAEGQSVVFFIEENKQVITSQYLASEVFPRSAQTGIWAFGAGTGTIKCISYPTGAEVWLDGEYTNKKTASNIAYLTNIIAGYHLITFKKIIDNVPRECSVDITVIKDQTVDVECTLPTSSTNTGTIKCISYPTSAEVWLNGNYTGKKTSSNVAYLFDIVTGPHTITLKKIINNAPRECSDNVTVVQDQTVIAECTLPTGATPTPTPGPIPTPTPPPEEIGTWNVEDAKDTAGAILSAAKVYIDNVYLHHYAPEKIIFCDGCSCDNLTPCGFGTHTLTIKRSGYIDWSATRTIAQGTNIFEFPVMVPIGVTPTPTPVPTPTPPPAKSGQIHCKTTGPTGAPIIGAKIYITGNNLSDVYMGNTDSIITVGVGTYIVKYIYLGYEDCIKGVNVSENQTVDGTCQMKPITIHTVSIESVPPGATITIL